MSQTLHAVVMAGGSGTRFWPASRTRRPKQFLPISGGRAMIAETTERLRGLIPLERILVVTAGEQAELVFEALPELPRENVLVEPEARNTAPCVALATYELLRRDPDSIQVVLPADHVIQPAEAFRESIAAAAAVAGAEEVLITFGIRPSFPATGYGYIKSGANSGEQDGIPVLRVESFVEKPDLARAEAFLRSGDYLWNSGMFVWSSRTIWRAFEEHMPAVPQGLARLTDGKPLEEVYAQLPAMPVDVGILEQAANVRMLPIDYRWSDVGSWAALTDVLPADASRNVSALPPDALLISEDAEGCIAYAEEDEVVALVGVRDLVVVRSGNATLVCPIDRAQDVRRIVERLRKEGKRFL